MRAIVVSESKAWRQVERPVRGTAGIAPRVAITRLFLAIAFANGLWFIWSNRFLPLVDYPDWMFQGFLFSKLLTGHLPHAYALKRYPVPNAIVTAALGVLNLLMPPEAAGKVVLTAAIAAFLFGSVYLLESLPAGNKNPFLLLPAVLMFNTHLLWGELSFVLGVSLFFMYSAILIRRIDGFDNISGRFFLAWSCAIFFSHLLAYLFALLITVVFGMQNWNRQRALRLAVAFTPTAIMTLWYAAVRISAHDLGSGPLWVPWTPHLIAGRYLAAFSSFPQFLPWLGIEQPVMKLAAILDLAMGTLMGLVWAACAAAWIRGGRGDATVLLAAAVFTLGFLLTGFAFAGWVGPGERFLYPAAWLAMCWLGAGARAGKWKLPARAATVGLIALLSAQCAFVDVYAAGVSDRLAGVYRQLSDAPTRAEFCKIYDSYRKSQNAKPHRTGLDRFLTNYPTVTRLPYYIYAERDVAAPIFQVGIFSYGGPGNNEDLCL